MSQAISSSSLFLSGLPLAPSFLKLWVQYQCGSGVSALSTLQQYRTGQWAVCASEGVIRGVGRLD